MTNPIVAKVEQWLWQIALKKGTYQAVKVIVSFLTSAKIAAILEGSGVKVDPVVLTGALTTAFASGLTFVLNWLKVKFKLNWL